MPNINGIELSIVVPLFNEEASLRVFHISLINILNIIKKSYEIIYIDDGSEDETCSIVNQLIEDDKNIKLIKLSRNFGKESALSAGISEARGKAIMSIDGDGQHPVELLPEFIKCWESGSQTVIGVRDKTESSALFKRLGSWLFYKIFNRFADQKLIPGSTDFRLIDRAVQQEFLRLPETDRITRGLIDWLGFRQELIYFNPKIREKGTATYSNSKLLKLAMNSLVSLTPKPLFIFGYIGSLITILALMLGISVIFEQIIFNDPLKWKFTGTAMLGILIVFLVGLVLLSQSILALYVSHAHNQTLRRPLYIIDYDGSSGVTKK
jgi:glycosyltransferase involved in cell wall biosynthesis